jgi:lipopolysaccharide biosynthesis glycosyltransferase
MLHSLLVEHPNRTIQIDVLHCGDTSRRSRARLVTMVSRLGGELRYRAVPDSWVAGLPIEGFTGKATWYRIWLDELLPDARRVLYLDVDLLVMDSLEPLWFEPLGDSVVAAVTNVPPDFERDYVKRPEMQGDRYFNAGVLILDLERMRTERLGEQLREFSFANASRLRWRDQDALNEVLHARRHALDPRWNYMNSMIVYPWATDYFEHAVLEAARRAPAVRHFEGPDSNKPWHVLSDPVQRRLYAEHRAQTPWRRVPVTGCTPRNLGRWARARLV